MRNLTITNWCKRMKKINTFHWDDIWISINLIPRNQQDNRPGERAVLPVPQWWKPKIFSPTLPATLFLNGSSYFFLVLTSSHCLPTAVPFIHWLLLRAFYARLLVFYFRLPSKGCTIFTISWYKINVPMIEYVAMFIWLDKIYSQIFFYYIIII